MEVESGWQAWKNMLGKIVNAAESVGMSNDRVNNAAYRVGDFFAGNFDPDNREQRVLKELWDEADEEQKQVLATLMVRVVEKTQPRH